MSHRNARLNVRDRQLLIERVCEQGSAVAHAANAQGISRQCAHRWANRIRQGAAGLEDRSSRPHHCPRQTPVEAEEVIVAMRGDERRGQDWIGPSVSSSGRSCWSMPTPCQPCAPSASRYPQGPRAPRNCRRTRATPGLPPRSVKWELRHIVTCAHRIRTHRSRTRAPAWPGPSSHLNLGVGKSDSFPGT